MTTSARVIICQVRSRVRGENSRSSLITRVCPEVMAKVVEMARERGLLSRTRIVVGGAPLSEEYAREIGADAYCFDGLSAVDRVKEFVGAD